ncbi:hypothetical protein BT69DRAFT_1291717 [Atractiella rhizophila]|nr:hypothetical protein BT69DRAFT_1291717 [Atractiella rhizophila]
MPDLWNKCCTTLKLQNGHIAKGCLIPKHQQLLFTTSNNENWHNAAGEPFCGSASSLTTFRKKVIEAGTHHIFLVDRNHRLEEILYSSSQPKLLAAFSKHEFRLVKHESNRYKAKRKELLQTLKPDDIECPEVIVMAVMNGMVVMNEKHMATHLDSEDDATVTLTISSKCPHLNQELLEPDIKQPSIPCIWNFTKSNQFTSSTNIDVETFTSATGTLFAAYQEKRTIQIYSDAFWKLAACQLQFKAISSTTEKQPKLFAENYNNPQLILNCAIEKEGASHIQRIARGDLKVTYTMPTKNNTLGAVKTCGRCKNQKDGYGSVPTAEDQLTPYPTLQEYVGEEVPQSVEMINMQVFMAMTWVEEKMDWVLIKKRLHIEAGKRK